MSHEVETMAWANEVPWHGLGNRVDSSISIDDMLVAAGLNWTVDPHDTFTEINGKRIQLPRKAMVRSSDGKIMTVTGDNWKPFQNKDALEFFREYCNAGSATLETAGSLRGGHIVWGLASVNKAFKLNGRDEVKGYILLTTSHLLGTANTVRATSVRVVCANTLAMAERGSPHYKQSHSREFDVAKAKEMVAFTQDQIGTMELEAQALQKLKMSEYDTVRLLAKYFQPVEVDIARFEKPEVAEAVMLENKTRIEMLINDPKTQNKALSNVLMAVQKAPGATPGNGWGVLNGVTFWADHMGGRETDARMFRSWLGHTGQRKLAVKEELLQMAA